MNSGNWDLEQELLDSAGKEHTFEQKVQIMEKLLDSESTLFSSRMRSFLLGKDVINILMKHITRPPEPAEEELDPPQERLHSDEFIFSSNRRRDALLADTPLPPKDDESDEEDLQFSAEAKRADKAAEVFVYQITSFPMDWVEKNMETILSELFRIFHVKSKGDFDNFDKVFQSVFTRYSTHVYNVLSRNPKLVLSLLDYLHDPAISETLLAVMRPQLPEQLLIKYYNNLNAQGFFQRLGEKIFGNGADSSFEDASAFFVRMIETCSTFNHADVLFSELVRDFTFVDGLVDTIASSSSPASSSTGGSASQSTSVPATRHQQVVACITALRALLIKSGEQLFDSSLEAYTPTPLPNMLAGIHDELHAHLKDRAGSLCAKILDDGDQQPSGKKKSSSSSNSSNNTENAISSNGPTRYSSYEVRSRFTLHRVALLDVLVELADENPHAVLDTFPPAVWRVLSNWLFEHKFNNVYHALFYKLFKTTVRANHVESLKALLSKHRFLTKMIEHYNTTTTTDSGLRGFILLMGNFLRLTADTLPPSEYLPSFLNSHGMWKEFLVKLREDTVRQHVTDYSPIPMTHVNISPFSMHDSFGMYGRQQSKPVTADDVKIDLGSDYANSLGFEDAVAYVPTSQEQRSRRRRKRRRRASTRIANNAQNQSNSNSQEEEEEEEEEEEGEDEVDDEDDKQQQQERRNQNQTNTNNNNSAKSKQQQPSATTPTQNGGSQPKKSEPEGEGYVSVAESIFANAIKASASAAKQQPQQTSSGEGQQQQPSENHTNSV